MSVHLTELIARATQCLEDLGLADKTIRDYQYTAFGPLERRIKEREVVSAEMLIEQESFFYEQFERNQISRQILNKRLRGVRILVEVNETGTFRWKIFRRKRTPALIEPFEAELRSFLQTKECSQKRKDIVESICRRFLLFLQNDNITSFDHISSEELRRFINEIAETRPRSIDEVIYSLRAFFNYLYEAKLCRDNFWFLLAPPKHREQHVLGFVSPNEVTQILDSIDRNSADGKRAFAVIALAASTGLRPGDIASLRLDNIKWKEHEIRLVQGKTSEPLTLPLQKTVLDALADYILNGRPETSSPNLFVRHCAPYQGYRDGGSIACIFRKYQQAAGLEHQKGDGKTFHGLRRGLGTTMTAEGVSVDTVAQILGHKSLEATKRYIAADLDHLRSCTLGFDSLEKSKP